MERKSCGARIIPIRRKSWTSYRELLKDNLTTPMKMELLVADADGSNQKQITNFGCASFAPTFTPDGKKILFSSNKHNATAAISSCTW